MDYAAVISLKNTIQLLKNSSRISIVSPNLEILECAYKDVESLQEVLEILDENRNNSTKRMKALVEEMTKAVRKLEDVIESHVSNQLLSQSDESLAAGEGGRPFLFSLNLQELRQDFDCFTEMAKKMEEECVEELDNPLFEEEEEEEEDDDGGDDDDAFSSRTDVHGNKSQMVGLSDQFCEIRDVLLKCERFTTISIVGMAGIGKTALAKKIFKDPLILRKYERRIFVKVGQKCQLKELLQAILAQMDPGSDKIVMEGDEKLYEYLCKILNASKYLIVLDDLWNADFWGDFIRGFVNSGTHILVTTRLRTVARYIGTGEHPFNIRKLHEEESWDLFRGKLFAEELCPPQLEKAGKKIAANCEGLPLLIIEVANLLSKAEKTSEYWKKVATGKQNSIFIGAYDQILKVLYPSYHYLPQYLKAFFLYMGAFPQNYDVRCSKLINLAKVEGFLEPYPDQSLEDFALKCLEELVSSNLVEIRHFSLKSFRNKVFTLHSICWHLCKKEARVKKFLLILNGHADSLTEGIESQYRVSIHNNILLGIRDVYNSVTYISNLRSLLCTGAYHQYQVPICFHLRLLRVLDALTIRFYEFPIEVLILVRLRYLALTCNGHLPPSISKLWNLQYLIICQHLSLKSTIAQSYLPMEIWDLKDLEYLQIMGRNLPDPYCGAVLPNLLTLLDVGTHSCTKGVFESLPSLNKLRVQIELAHDAAEPLSCFDHISHLSKLQSLHFVIANPELKSKIVAPPPLPLSIFASQLLKLTLSGFGYPWKDMKKIAELPQLKVLKLQQYAFRGEKWEAEEMRFSSLHNFTIEDTDLVQWTFGYRTFPGLFTLTVKNCYKLQGIPIPMLSLGQITLVDCNPSAVTCVQQMITDGLPKTYVYSSWDDGNLKS